MPALLVLVFCLHAALFAQTDDLNHLKYWSYRQRLVNTFMVVGPEPGQSIPAGIRNLWNGPALHFGDAPVYMGYYIGVLSTEYRLLADRQQPAERTLTELFYALEAINRLDEEAEPLWGVPNAHHERNGFIIQSDIPADFCQRYTTALNSHLGKQMVNTGSGIGGMVNNVVGGLDTADNHNNTCSQDQIANLLIGLALCVKLAPDMTQFRDELTGITRSYSFRESAKEIAGRLLSYMRDTPYGGLAWTLHAPDGVRLSNGKGGNARPNAYGFAAAGKWITGKEYADFTSRFTHFYWKAIYARPVLRLHPDDLLFGLELSPIGDSWRGAGSKSKTVLRINRCASYDVSKKLKLWPENKFGWDYFFEALCCTLHDSVTFEGPGADSSKARLMLDQAPVQGPFYHNPSDRAAAGWAGSSGRFYDTPPNQEKGKNGFEGNYNGLDYMLCYNLYRLLSETSNKQADKRPYQMPGGFPNE